MFTLSDEHRMLAEAARGFVQDKMPVTHLRALRDSGSAEGFDRALWGEMAAMGWTGILVPEDFGGAGLDRRALALVLEECGRTLAPSPLLSTAMVGAVALSACANEDLKAAWLPKIADGSVVMAVAVDEGPHHGPAKTKAAIAGGKLTGKKSYVVDGAAADLLLVLARNGGELALALVDAGAPGVERRALKTVDGRGAVDISFSDAAVLGVLKPAAGSSAAYVDHVLDCARAGLAAEMLGQATQAFEQTAEYLKTRTQFGQLIGSFQALQHRAGKMLVELELTKSCVIAALDALDKGREDAGELVSLAKARAGETLHLVTNEMVQMHGGIGMTDAHDSGLYLKRARVAEALYGSASFHRDRYATLCGF
jgi:alkylation response protein AidB-like acyl-CoA dehydrogenase